MMPVTALAALQNARDVLLQDAAQRDHTTARRICILNILWQERFLTREQLISRVEGELGKGCFGDRTFEDIFYRDMRLVKMAMRTAGRELVNSQSPQKPCYYLSNQPSLNDELAHILDGAIAEVDAAQIAILGKLSPAERFRQGVSISNTARRVVAHRICQRNGDGIDETR